MSVHTKKDGRHFVVYREEGRRIERYFGRGAINRLRAERFDHGKKAEKNKAGFAGSLTVAALCQAYHDQHLVQASTYKMDAYRLAIIIDRLGQNQADLLSTNDLARYVQKRLTEPIHKTITKKNGKNYSKFIQTGVTRTTIANEIRRLKAAYNWACNQNPPPLLFNPIASFKLTGLETPDVPTPPHLGEVQKILAHAKPHLIRAIFLHWGLGVRPGGELFRIKWQDVDLVYGMIRVISARKNGPAVRLIPICEELKSLLEGWLIEDRKLAGDNIFSFPVVHYREKAVMSLKKSWASAKKQAGITRRMRLYDLRHAFATVALQAGADLKALSELLGHGRPDTTLRFYQHVSRPQHRQVIDKIPFPKFAQLLTNTIVKGPP